MLFTPNALMTVTFLLFAIPLVTILLYGALLLHYSKKGRTQDLGSPSPYEPTVSIVIPTHNEANAIDARIKNLLAVDYPKEKTEIIFVDDSNDSTPSLIEGYARDNPSIRLIRFSERMGYSRSVLAGCKATTGEIIVLAEIGAIMNQDTIRTLVSNFSDPSVGVVTGQDLILNTQEGVGRAEQWYQKIYNLVRSGESNMDSTFYIKGEAAAARGDLIRNSKEFESCPAGTGTADTAMALVARKEGLRAIYDPRVKFFEFAPLTHRDRVRQKVNRGANLIKILWYFRNMFFRTKYGKFGMVTLPVNFMMLAIAPVMLLAGVIALMALTLVNPLPYLPVWILVGVIFLFAYALYRPAVITAFEFEYSLVKADFEITFIRKDHDKLEKIASTRRFSS